VYVALALAVLAVALLAAKPVLRRDRVLETPAAGHDLRDEARRVEWGAIGAWVFSWIAGTGLVLAAVVLFSADAAWLPPAVRVALGLAAGIALLIAGQRPIAPRYRLTADAMTGAAIGILYATFYAVLMRWQLGALPIVIVGMLLVSAVAERLAARRDALLMALVGLIGGFAMPAMPASSPSIEHPVLLFSYLLLLDAGIAWLAIRKRLLWPMVLSIVFTAIFEWAWVLQFLASSQLLLAAAIFAAVAIVGTSPLWYERRDERPEGLRWIAAAAAHLPLLFALYMVVIPNHGARYSILFGFLLVVDAGLAAIAWRGGPRWLHAAGGVATLLIFFLWLRLTYTHASWPWSLLWLALFVALYLVAAEAAPFAALLFFVFIGLAQREPHHEAALIAAMLALLAVVLAGTMQRGRRQPITAAIAIALSAIALMTLHPPLWLLLAIHAILLIALFAVAWISGRHLLAVLAIPFYVAMLITASYAPDWAYSPAVTLLGIALVPYLLFIAYPLALSTLSALGARARESIAPYVAAALAGLVFFAAGWTVRNDVADTHRWLIGLVPLAAALAMLALLWRLRTLPPREPMAPMAPMAPMPPTAPMPPMAPMPPREPRLTLVASAALAFFNASIPMLLPKPWAVVLWALEVAALAWLFTRVKHGVLRVWSALLAAAVFLWLAFDADLYAPWRVFAIYTVCGVAMIAAAYLARRDAPALQVLLSVAGLFELWFLLNIAIANGYHAANGALTFDFGSTPHAADATYTIAWAVIATGLLILGFVIHWPAARGAALALLLTTIFKCLVNDLPRLRGLDLAASLLGLALSLVVVGVVLQKHLSASAVDVPASA
jgi:hypothetical protein